MRSLDETQKLDEAERNETPFNIVCDQCGNSNYLALGKPTDDVGIMAARFSRYCNRCNIVVCGSCAAVTPHPQINFTVYQPCPRCQGATVYGAAYHLRLTRTKLL